MRRLSTVYWILLTVMLLVRNPLSWFGPHVFVEDAYDFVEPIVHFLCFLLLTLLVLSARWQVARPTLILLLMVYGLGAELMQLLVPWRSFEYRDLLQNWLGVVCGLVLQRWYERRRSAKQSQRLDAA